MARSDGGTDQPRVHLLRDVVDRADVIRAAARLYAGECASFDVLLDDVQTARALLGLPPLAPEGIQDARTTWAAARPEGAVRDAAEDPLAGLVGTEARARLRELSARCADGDPSAGGHYVAVVLSALEGAVPEPRDPRDGAGRDRPLVELVAEPVRLAFDRCELVTSWGAGRVLAVVERDPFTENRVAELEWLLRRRLPSRYTPQVRAADLPGREADLVSVLAGLATPERWRARPEEA